MDNLNDHASAEASAAGYENTEFPGGAVPGETPLQESCQMIDSADGHVPDFSAIAARTPEAQLTDTIEFEEADPPPDDSPDGGFVNEVFSAYSGKEAAKESDAPAGKQKKAKKKKHSFGKSLCNGILVFFAVLGIFYLTIVYSSNQYIVRFRNTYIQTAMSTLNHKYLATAFFPSETIDNLLRMQYETDANAVGVQSNWGTVVVNQLPSFSSDSASSEEAAPETAGTAEAVEVSAAESAQETGAEAEAIAEGDSGDGRSYSCEDEKIFFELFYELDYDSVQEYVADNPEVLDDGWAHININEAGLDDYGTSIETVHGDEVLAINAAEGIVLIRININSSRGVMAICKDTSKLSLCPAETLGTIGQTAGRICDAAGGILAINGSAFYDDGTGDGGQISGLAVCSGTVYGSPLGGSDKRLELRNDNKMYIVDSISDLNSDTRDACEFRPALIVDGEIVVDDDCGWTGPNPRATIGQTSNLETVMCVLEGRLSDSPGDSVVNLAYLMQEYGCVQALNLDGGTSAIMYYDGEYITRCSNPDLPSGRTLPTAWVYY